MTATETTGWRDQALSARHRQWGYHAPAADVDFFMVEYDTGETKALVDYKIVGSRERGVNRDSPTMRALGSMHSARGEQLPLFVAYYDPAHWSFYVRPMNAAADEWVRGPVRFSEQEWVAFLHRLRGREAPGLLPIPLSQSFGPDHPMSPEEAEEWRDHHYREQQENLQNGEE